MKPTPEGITFITFGTERVHRKTYAAGKHSFKEQTIISERPFTMEFVQVWTKACSDTGWVDAWVDQQYRSDTIELVPEPEPRPSWWRRLLGLTNLPAARVVKS